MRRQYGHSCGSFIPPLVGGGILSCVEPDDDDGDAGTTVLWEPAGSINKIQNDTKKFLNRQ